MWLGAKRAGGQVLSNCKPFIIQAPKAKLLLINPDLKMFKIFVVKSQ